MTCSPVHRRRLPSLVALMAVLALLGVPAAAQADVQVWFLSGEQLGKVARPGTTTEDAVRQLLAGPTAAERAKGARTQLPGGTPVRAITLDGDLATVDLGLRFVLGNQSAESQNARLAQLMSTVNGTVGVPGSPTPESAPISRSPPRPSRRRPPRSRRTRPDRRAAPRRP